MKKKFLALIASVFMVFGVTTFSACNITEVLDTALKFSELQEYVTELEKENTTLKTDLATLKFETVYPDHIIGGEDIVELNYTSLKVEGEGDAIVVTDNAQVTINGGTYDGGQTPFGGAGNKAVWVKNANAKVIINDGTFKISGLAINEAGDKDEDHIDLIYCSAGTIEINGGWFEGATSDVWLVNCKDDPYLDGTAKIIIRGGTFVNFDPSNCLTENVQDENGNQIPVSYVAEGYIVVKETKKGVDYYTVIETPIKIEDEIPEE